jgi:hypothetical protein
MDRVRVVAEPDGAVMGAVFEISGDFFDGARVELWQDGALVASDTTDEFGQFVVFAPGGAYSLVVTRAGYTTLTTSVSIVSGQATQLVIQDDWTEDGVLKHAPMPLKPDLRYVLRVFDRWTSGEISTQTMAILVNNWKDP